MSTRKYILKNTRSLQRFLALRNIRRVGCWFVDIPRTSSTSIRVELGRIFGLGFGKECCAKNEKINQVTAFDDHIPAYDMKRLLGADFWQRSFTFSFVRNPWDRFLSLYFYRKTRGNLPADLSFKDYVRQLDEPRYRGRCTLHSYPVYYYSMSEYLLDSDGNLLVDFVGRYENREHDLKVVADRLGVEFSGIHLQKVKLREHHYSQYYDEETKALVARVYQMDVAVFGYEFEDKR